jgi:hypothetical protein
MCWSWQGIGYPTESHICLCSIERKASVEEHWCQDVVFTIVIASGGHTNGYYGVYFFGNG